MRIKTEKGPLLKENLIIKNTKPINIIFKDGQIEYRDDNNANAETTSALRKEKITWVCRDNDKKKLTFFICFENNRAPLIDKNSNDTTVYKHLRNPILPDKNGKIIAWITPSADYPKGIYKYTVFVLMEDGEWTQDDPEVIIPEP